MTRNDDRHEVIAFARYNFSILDKICFLNLLSLIITDWHDIENNVASASHLERFKSKEFGIKKLQDMFIIPCVDGSLRQNGHAERQTSRDLRVESPDPGRVPSTLQECPFAMRKG